MHTEITKRQCQICRIEEEKAAAVAAKQARREKRQQQVRQEEEEVDEEGIETESKMGMNAGGDAVRSLVVIRRAPIDDRATAVER